MKEIAIEAYKQVQEMRQNPLSFSRPLHGM